MQISRDLFVLRFNTGFLLLCAGAIFLLPIKWLFGFAIAAIVHELAHYAALLILGVQIYAVEIGEKGIVIRTEPLSNKQEFICAIAGPAGGLLLMFATYRIPHISVSAFVQSFYNLLPFECLDGGRTLRCLLSKLRHGESIFHFCETTARIVLCVLLCYVAVISVNMWTRLLVILMIYRLWHQKYLAKKENQ